MVNEVTEEFTASRGLQAAQVYSMAALCLVIGLTIGYLFRSPQKALSQGQPISSIVTNPGPGVAPDNGLAGKMQDQAAQKFLSPSPHSGGRAMPSLGEMKLMADRQAAPLLEKLKSDPNNSALLVQVGTIYHSTHQFREASTYYEKAVQADPKNVADRTKLAASLYRSGEVDGAIAQLNKALLIDPKDANSLFNLGMIKLQGKQDGKGALAAWQLLLKTNPQLSADRKAMVEKLMADVLTSLGDQHRTEGALGK